MAQPKYQDLVCELNCELYEIVTRLPNILKNLNNNIYSYEAKGYECYGPKQYVQLRYNSISSFTIVIIQTMILKNFMGT